MEIYAMQAADAAKSQGSLTPLVEQESSIINF